MHCGSLGLLEVGSPAQGLPQRRTVHEVPEARVSERMRSESVNACVDGWTDARVEGGVGTESLSSFLSFPIWNSVFRL